MRPVSVHSTTVPLEHTHPLILLIDHPLPLPSMLLECSECGIPYYTYEDLQMHFEMTHPKIHRRHNRLDVRIIKRVLNRHQKTYRCPLCSMPFPHPLLRDSHVQLGECDSDTDDSDSDYGPDAVEDPNSERGSIVSLFTKFGRHRKPSSAPRQPS
ncbi:hypothetical protein B0H15DRAFT_421945 [Mycena belliarum]|uniref:C2H2-type domain-containing protein n=1 Tax=Mycena belliarum TaxID=1033014 RepID=A0AAD6TZW5_9AGAR|nr:hypothetical protein B0H15DRAFT_421945 [Mycena belliae]